MVVRPLLSRGKPYACEKRRKLDHKVDRLCLQWAKKILSKTEHSFTVI